jgi:hypothetical protein
LVCCWLMGYTIRLTARAGADISFSKKLSRQV